MNYITFSVLKNASDKQLADIFELFVQADFTEPATNFDWLSEAVKGSLTAVIAEDDTTGKVIGFARALGDGASDCYIQDAVVSGKYRNRGIGKKLVQFLLEELARKNIDWIGLIATPGKADFYRKLGFETMTDFTPMILKNPPAK